MKADLVYVPTAHWTKLYGVTSDGTVILITILFRCGKGLRPNFLVLESVYNFAL
jgi:hypothetical protein